MNQNKHTLISQKINQAQYSVVRLSSEIISENFSKVDHQTENIFEDRYCQIFDKVSSTLKTQNNEMIMNKNDSNGSDDDNEQSWNSDSESDDELTNLISQNIHKLKLK